jgi:hypothetical protein
MTGPAGSAGRFCQSLIDSKIRSVIGVIVSFDTDAP